MSKLTVTQTIILSAGAQRQGYVALPLPKGLAGAAAKMAVGKMIERGWLQEVEATRRLAEPLWRETGDGHGVTLVVTEAGLEAIGIEPPKNNGAISVRRESTSPVQPAMAPGIVKMRVGTKQALVTTMLQRPEGATIAELVAATGWQAHTLRGVFSGVLKSRLGLTVTVAEVEGRGKVYRANLQL